MAVQEAKAAERKKYDRDHRREYLAKRRREKDLKDFELEMLMHWKFESATMPT